MPLDQPLAAPAPQENELDVTFSTDADSAFSAISFPQARGVGIEAAVPRPLWRPLFAWDDTLALEESATITDGEEYHDQPAEDDEEGALRELLWFAPGQVGSEHDAELTSVLRDALRPPSPGRASNSGASAVEAASPGVSPSRRVATVLAEELSARGGGHISVLGLPRAHSGTLASSMGSAALLQPPRHRPSGAASESGPSDAAASVRVLGDSHDSRESGEALVDLVAWAARRPRLGPRAPASPASAHGREAGPAPPRGGSESFGSTARTESSLGESLPIDFEQLVAPLFRGPAALPTGQAALSEGEAQALPRVRFEAPERTRCSICLEQFGHGMLLSSLGCGHIFHVDCLATWVQRCARCPNCRACVVPLGQGARAD